MFKIIFGLGLILVGIFGVVDVINTEGIQGWAALASGCCIGAGIGAMMEGAVEDY